MASERAGNVQTRQGRVYACERPEAPPERGVWFHTATMPCRGCLIALEAAARNFPDHVNKRGRTIHQMLARARRMFDAAE